MDDKYEELFKKWLDLDYARRMLAFSGVFGRMKYMREKGTKADKAAAETFFEEVEIVLEKID